VGWLPLLCKPCHWCNPFLIENLAEENEGKKQQSEDRNFVLVDGKGTLKLPEPLEAWAL
jgi:hypothetical protein